MYDHPPSLSSPFSSSSSTTSSSSPLPSVKMTRSNSPIPHISTLLPHHHHHHSQYSPSSQQADVSRLLDPSYASHNSSSSGSSSRSASQPAQTRAYVDHRGDLHDPDYRDFPVLPTRQKSNTPRRRNTSSSQLLNQHHSTSRLAVNTTKDRYSTYPLVARPDWERDWATEIEDLEEDEEVLDLSSTFVRTSSDNTTPSSRRASLPPSIYAHSTFFANEPMSTTSSPVDSLEEQQEEPEHTVSHSPFEDLGAAEELMEVEETASARHGRASSLLRRMKRNASQASVPMSEPPSATATQPPAQLFQFTTETKEVVEEVDEPEFAHNGNERCGVAPIELDDEDTVPTCTFILRRQLRAVTLRLRFGMFHVRRRLMRPRRNTI